VKAPAFWDEDNWRSRLVAPFAALYGAISQARLRRPPAGAVDVPVICVGNFTLGGAGKTPTVLFLARHFRSLGERPFVLSRGYGGSLKGPLVVNPAHHHAGEVGDEPSLMAQEVPVVIGADRLATARLAVAQGASLLLMDDGLQNPRLKRDCRLAIVDSVSGIGNARVFPAGPLRAPLGAQFELCDGVLLIGEGPRGAAVALTAAQHGKPVFRGRLVADDAARRLAGLKVLAFCGIGRPEKFRASLSEAGVEIGGFVAFADHHVLAKHEADQLMRRATAEGLALVTTPKDQARLLGDPYTRQALAGLVNVAGIDLVLDTPDEFIAWLGTSATALKIPLSPSRRAP